MTIIDRIKTARTAALAHEKAAHDFRVAAFAKYEAETDDDVNQHVYDSSVDAHRAACEALTKLESLLELVTTINTAQRTAAQRRHDAAVVQLTTALAAYDRALVEYLDADPAHPFIAAGTYDHALATLKAARAEEAAARITS
jgi:hypothetical protein